LCGHWYTKFNEENILATSPNVLRVPDVLQLNKRKIPFVNSVKDGGVIFVKGMIWGFHIKSTAAKILAIHKNVLRIQNRAFIY
jgi:hypothetical protein